ncbi:MAG: hypothetical protein MH825_13030 [Cyanobacteria bacterium]|nr:hypothetical protein [Cyanobacteriota bacterium]
MAAYRDNDPATHPRPDDLLWNPISDIHDPWKVCDRWVDDDGAYWLELENPQTGETIEDPLYRWDFYPRPGDTVVVALGPVARIYSQSHRRIWDAPWLHQKLHLREMADRPRRGIHPPGDWAPFAACATDSGDVIYLPLRCLVVYNYRYPPTIDAAIAG